MTDTQRPKPTADQEPVAGSKDERPANALTVPAFHLLWANNVFYFLVMNAQRFVLGWFVLDGLDGNEQDQALAIFAFGIPSIFIVLHAGVWADRHDRRRLLMGSQIASLIAMAAFAVLLEFDRLTFNWVLILAVFAGVACDPRLCRPSSNCSALSPLLRWR